jgi:hypothetical protein
MVVADAVDVCVQGESKEKAKKERKKEAMLDVGQKTLDLSK